MSKKSIDSLLYIHLQLSFLRELANHGLLKGLLAEEAMLVYTPAS